MTGSIEGKFDKDDEVWDLFREGDEVNLALFLDRTSLNYFYIPAIMSNFSLETDIDGGPVTGWTADWEANGKYFFPNESGAPLVQPVTTGQVDWA
jgi:hypothetical protein